MTEDEMVGWHHRPDGHEFEQAPGVGDGQGGLACCSPRGHKDSDTAEQLNKSYLAPSPISEFFFGVVFLYPVPPCPPTNTVHESLPPCLSHSAIMIFSYVTSHQRQNPFPSLRAAIPVASLPKSCAFTPSPSITRSADAVEPCSFCPPRLGNRTRRLRSVSAFVGCWL